MTHYEVPWRDVYEARAAVGWTAASASLVGVAATSALAAGPALLLAALSAGFALKRIQQSFHLWDLQMGLSGAALISVTSDELKSSISRRSKRKEKQRVFLGRGFEWKAKHAQRLYDLSKVDLHDVLPPDWYLALRGRPTSTQNAEFAGSPWIHGVGMDDEDVLEVPLEHMEGQAAVFGTTGAGKALRPDALVHTPDGWKLNMDLVEGDVVSTPDGQGATVLGVYPQLEQDWYSIRFNDGRVVTAGAEHLWEVSSQRWTAPRVMDTSAIIACMKAHPSLRLYVRLTDAVEKPQADLPIPPYVLGVLLGSGAFFRRTVSYTKQEPSVFRAMSEELESTPWQLSRSTGTLANAIIRRRAGTPLIADELSKLNLLSTRSWERFVPRQYLESSVEQRLALLQGLMDTDGRVQDGSISYLSTSRQLAQDVQELVWSLGGTAELLEKKRKEKDGRQMRSCWRVGMRARAPRSLFRNESKAIAVPAVRANDTLRLRIEDIEHVGVEEGICIHIDHPEHLYIYAEPSSEQGPQYVVTHNTRMAEVLVAQAILRGEVVVVIDPKFDQDLVDRMWQTCVEAGREADFRFFHPGYPRHSVRIDPLANFGKGSELASRIASLLPSEGQAATFQAYAWSAINTIVGGQLAIYEKPTLASIRQYLLLGVDALLERVLAKHYEKLLGPAWQEQMRPFVDRVNKGSIKKPAPTSSNEVTAYAAYYSEKLVPAGNTNDVIDALVEAFTHGREHHMKMISSLIPLVNMLATGHLGMLLSPDALDLSDNREITDSAKIIQSGSVVYMALDSLPDKTVAGAIGAITLADFAAAAGAIYNYTDPDSRKIVSLFVDEAAEVVCAPFLSILNKARGAGFRVTIFTQLLSDLVSRMGSEDAALQLLGNLNNNIALRSIDAKTQEYLTSTFGRVPIQKLSQSASTNTHSTELIPSVGKGSSASLTAEEVPLVEPATLGKLPNFHFFGRVSGGKIVKGRCPLFPKIPKEQRYTVKLLQSRSADELEDAWY